MIIKVSFLLKYIERILGETVSCFFIKILLVARHSSFRDTMSLVTKRFLTSVAVDPFHSTRSRAERCEISQEFGGGGSSSSSPLVLSCPPSSSSRASSRSSIGNAPFGRPVISPLLSYFSLPTVNQSERASNARHCPSKQTAWSCLGAK